jgi:death-on-curing protein
LLRNRRHYRVKLEEALAAHDFALTFGGLRGIRDLGAIEAAIARPYCGYYRSIAKKAAALIQSLASNHGFIDGNKRTALLMMNLLLLRSGYVLRGGSEQQINTDVETMILALVEHHMSFDDVVVWLEQRIVPIAPIAGR